MDNFEQIKGLSEQSSNVRTPNGPSLRLKDLKKPITLATTLRACASCLLLGSGVAFLLQGWSSWGTIARIVSFWILLCLTTASAIFCALKLKDRKGARVAMSLSLLGIPAIFAQLGFLIYDLNLRHAVLTACIHCSEQILFPSNPLNLALLCFGSSILAASMSLFGFRVLSRVNDRLITALFLLANLSLLLPTRDPNLIGILSLALFIGILTVENGFSRNTCNISVMDHHIAKGLLFIPLIVLIARTAFLYNPTTIFIGLELTCAGIFCFFILSHFVESPEWRSVFQAGGAAILSIAWLYLAGGLFLESSAMFSNVSEIYHIPLIGFPISIILLVLSRSAINKENHYHTVASAIANLTVLIQLLTVESLFSSLLCIVAALTAVIFGSLKEERGVALFGMVGLLGGILYHLKYALHLYNSSPWISLAVLGLLTLLLGSYFEKNLDAALQILRKARKETRRNVSAKMPPS